MMEDLIERLEKAAGPERQLDVDIFIAINPGATGLPNRFGMARIPCGDGFKVRKVDFFTRSIDAALTLVPEGFRWLVRNHNGKPTHDGDGDGARAFANVYRDEDEDETDYHCWGKQPATTICIAALKARTAK